MNYTVIFLFNPEMTEVLLLHKNRGPYVGCWNGVGGKIEVGEFEFTAAYREIHEETALEPVDYEALRRIVIDTFPNTGNVLHVFWSKVKDPTKVRQLEDEQLMWFDVNDLPPLEYLAGDGNVPYFI